MANKKTNGEIKRKPLSNNAIKCTNICSYLADIKEGSKEVSTKILNSVERIMIEGPYTVIKAFSNAVIKDASTVLKRVIKSFSKKEMTLKGNQLKLIIAMQKTMPKKRKPTTIEQSDNGRVE